MPATALGLPAHLLLELAAHLLEPPGIRPDLPALLAREETRDRAARRGMVGLLEQAAKVVPLALVEPRARLALVVMPGQAGPGALEPPDLQSVR